MATKQELLKHLPELPPVTGKRLGLPLINGIMAGGRIRERFLLAELKHRPGDYFFVPEPGVNLITKRTAKRKVMDCVDEKRSGFTKSLNNGLLGGSDYPVLTGVLGIVTGVVSGGAGIMFSLFTTGLSAAKTVQRVLVREGDEIWQTELVGKVRDDRWFGPDSYRITHVEYIMLVDPYRRQEGKQGVAWIIHEDRHELTVD